MKGPLASLKVLDFSTLLPGPFASLLLADMGARVLRVESPTRMDLVRVLPPHDDGVSASHAYLNRNKRSIALDLKRPEAVEVVKQLVREYDIVLEQFRPGVMDKLGVGYEALKAINPKLIYVSISGYGQTGPYRDRAGHDINYLALAGVASYTGRKDTGPLPLGVQLADIAGGSLHGVMGLLAAVIHRQQTGEGQQVDISMTDCAFSLNGMAGAGYLACGVEPGMEAQALNGGSFYDYYRTRDGRWFSVGSLEPQFMQQFCAAIGRPELAARGLSPKAEDQRLLKREIAIEFEKRDFADWRERFAAVDACVEPMLPLSEAVEHPQIQARGLVTEVPRGDGRSQRQMACPIRFSAGLPAPKHIGVAAGAHSAEVLAELGYSDEQVAALKAAGAVG
ncbi:crotonobetainyl-CoA:carnitine CoA-transferase CaiB-like acyl-CoA transferase [Pseudomonas citronellolis]|uniref:CaiB/BaiF CoA transferase family protein n=1 Tax=Pseudomonas citronellolis TaxID=53408 RepID=UPI00209F284E|nr:CaiB/BaiF CoA-transferase family protein [Pseudomonas citronellolis]MCP1646309.1 crotonobetainyl-CoA:carnitine CoA-transferase CaiB-like acyl-CoA transferase [Pseudomonas citronellolis]MCP1669229.1 crotonobetainyl-CoA:carnitine CoA-transferase CaiB-like acyl-CoA transferase [Pseudomonas citronellolis]MCP1700869.1 crotonobetainyl-CoA:carnitine CoA-transferase CaiB-like acyl-CoA transferase [Pseudomonas citronellolis]MCP1707065.1 crotonobetainyl-CoA:carnitine CoA-transferase CaiB-like acyl-CoA